LGIKHVDIAKDQVVHLISTAPLEQFFVNVKIGAFAAVALSFPIIAWQLYRFVAPGLYRKERNAFFPFLLAAPILFILGSGLVYFVMLPFVMWFSLTTQVSAPGVISQLTPKVSDYLNLVTQLMLAFGLCFQLPVVLTLVGMAGLIEYKTLAKFRRYAVLGIFVVAAIVTPPDPFSQFALAIPLCLLYEASIWCVWLAQRRRPRQVAA
ncbi:MAG: Sec-independent protein translocase, TatC subunit, partial [Caulobacteraceae bacterium]|nr:Sec-independent protein translocase, TatC subunit [Caulobacteraceae bacterium]